MIYLSHCSTLFQIFGHQYFSVRKLTHENQKDFPTLGYTIFFIFAFVVLLGQMVMFSFLESFSYSQDKLTAKTMLNLLVQHSMYIGLIVIIFVSLIQSFVSTPLTKKFFLNSIRIAGISHYDFGLPLARNHRRIRRETLRNFFFVILLYVVSENILYLYEKYFVESQSYLKNLISFLPLIYLNTTSFKFVFFVKLVNFHLENVNELINKIFGAPSKFVAKVKFVKPIKIQTDDLSAKLLKLRRIYNIIYENSEIINRTHGKTIFTVLFSLVLAITSSGYRLFLSAVGKVPLDMLGGEL